MAYLYWPFLLVLAGSFVWSVMCRPTRSLGDTHPRRRPIAAEIDRLQRRNSEDR